jgi:hypothetical protein
MGFLFVSGQSTATLPTGPTDERMAKCKAERVRGWIEPAVEVLLRALLQDEGDHEDDDTNDAQNVAQLG